MAKSYEIAEALAPLIGEDASFILLYGVDASVHVVSDNSTDNILAILSEVVYNMTKAKLNG